MARPIKLQGTLLKVFIAKLILTVTMGENQTDNSSGG
jgi:hypothetical protein